MVLMNEYLKFLGQKKNKKYIYIIKKSFCHLQIFTTFIVPVFRKNLFKLFCTLIPFIPCKVYLAEFQIKKTSQLDLGFHTMT